MTNWDAVGAIAETAGTVISAGSLVAAAAALIRESRRQREDRHAAEQNLAYLISAVTVPLTSDQAEVRVVNSGPNPVFHVYVRADGASRESELIRLLGPGQEQAVPFGTLPGEAEHIWAVLEWTDTFGRRWSRAGRAAPVRLPDIGASN